MLSQALVDDIFRCMKQLLTGVSAIVLFLLTTITQAQSIDPAKLAGVWENRGTNFTQRQMFRADGTFESTITSDTAALNRRESGQWKLADSILTLTIDQSSDEGRSGQSASFRVQQLTDEKLVIQKKPDQPQATVTFTRIKN